VVLTLAVHGHGMVMGRAAKGAADMDLRLGSSAVEQENHNLLVGGSNPSRATINILIISNFLNFWVRSNAQNVHDRAICGKKTNFPAFSFALSTVILT
jgi:hypothetical protein